MGYKRYTVGQYFCPDRARTRRLLYSDGVAEYPDLITGFLVLPALGHGYLQPRLNSYYCFRCYLARHETPDLNSLLPADKRGATGASLPLGGFCGDAHREKKRRAAYIGAA